MDTNQNQSKKIMQQNIAEVWLYFEWKVTVHLTIQFCHSRPDGSRHSLLSLHKKFSANEMTNWVADSPAVFRNWQQALTWVTARTPAEVLTPHSVSWVKFELQIFHPLSSLAGYLPHTVSTLKSPSPTQQNNYLIAFSWTKVTFLSYIHNVHTIIQAGLMM